MSVDASARCPGCSATTLDQLGQLQDARQFAGVPIERTLSGGHLYRCNNCCLKFRFPIETDAVYADLYDHDGPNAWTEMAQRRDWDLIVQHLSDRGSQHRSVLDFGCNTGGLLGRLGDDIDKYGIEISQRAAAVATEKHAVTVWPSVPEIPKEQLFDVIVAVDVVEHVRNPAELVETLLERLSPMGELILTTGDGDNKWWNRFGANWWYCFHLEHISFISQSWLTQFVKDRDASVDTISRFRYRELGALARFLHGLLMGLYGVAPGVYLLLRNLPRRLQSKPDIGTVLGNGVSADHLFVVLRRQDSQ